MWRTLQQLGIPEDFVARVIDIYTDSFFMVDSCDGMTDPIQQEVGVYQGCPLSPYLFIAALTPLLRALRTLSPSGVPLSTGIRECVSAYADDLKISAQVPTESGTCTLWSTSSSNGRICEPTLPSVPS